MTRVSIDDQVREIAGEKVTLDEALRQAITSIPPNRLVTKILINGHDAGDPAQLGQIQPNADIEDLQIRTIDKEIWSISGLDMSLSILERVQTSLIRAAEMLRDGDKSLANRFFAHCVEGLERFYEAVSITKGLLRFDFNVIQIDGVTLKFIENDFEKILKSILISQEQKDYSSVADKVEYELLTNLSLWKRALTQLRLNQMSNA